jgi:hypothetical protein
MKKLVVVMLLLACTQTFCLTLNPLIKGAYQQPLYGQPVLLGDHLLHQQIDESGHALWSYDTTSHQRFKLISGQLSFSEYDQALFRLGDQVYFLSYDQAESRSRLWRTDGLSLTELELPAAVPQYPVIRQTDGVLFIYGQENQLITVDPSEVVLQAFDHLPHHQNKCAFSARDYVIELSVVHGQPVQLVRVTDGIISDLSVDFADAFHTIPEGIFRTADGCVVSVRENGSFIDRLLFVKQSGEITRLHQLIDTALLFQVFGFKQQLYVMGQSATDGSSIVARMEPETGQLSAQFSLDPLNQFYFVRTTGEYIIAHSTTPTISPAINLSWYLNENLQHNPLLGGHLIPDPTAYPTLDGEVFVRLGEGTARQLSWSIDFTSDAVLNISRQSIHAVITDPDQSDVYVLMSHNTNNLTGIYALEDYPHTDENIRGIWHDPDIPNQGMVVTTGLRGDGSEYQFITFYTYRDGQPYWFAGQNEINPPQTGLEVELYQFTGGGLFSGTELPAAESIGTLSVHMTGCDRLSASLNLNGQPVTDLSLTRIENTAINQPCDD